jgi:hypothetical protein
MKKVCLTMMMLVFMVVGTQAQTTFGLKAGFNFATIGGDNSSIARMKIGYHFGGMASFDLSENLYLQPEFVVSLQGSGYSYSERELNEMWSVTGNYNLTYLNLPVMAKLFLTEEVSIHFGPQLGFLLSAMDVGKVSNDTGSESELYNDNVKQDFKPMDVSVGLGIGYELATGLNFNARYNHGLSNLNTVNDVKNNSSVFQISVGYFFGN